MEIIDTIEKIEAIDAIGYLEMPSGGSELCMLGAVDDFVLQIFT